MTDPLLAPAPAGAAQWVLPSHAYWDLEWFRAEQRLLFGRTWQLACTVEDVEAGPVAVAVAGSTLVLEERDGRYVALHGDRAKTGSPAVGQWGCYLFVHLDPQHAEPFEQWIGDVPERVGGFRPELLVELARHRFEVAGNWKLFVENHIDAYHLWFLHEESLSSYDHPAHRWGEQGRHWLFYEPPREQPPAGNVPLGRGLLPIRHLTGELEGSGAHLLFPNLPMATGPGFFMTYQAVPVAPDRTVVDIRMRGEHGSDPAEAMALSRLIIDEEDGAACRAVQAGVRSPWFQVGPLAADHELAITRFHQHILEALER